MRYLYLAAEGKMVVKRVNGKIKTCITAKNIIRNELARKTLNGSFFDFLSFKHTKWRNREEKKNDFLENKRGEKKRAQRLREEETFQQENQRRRPLEEEKEGGAGYYILPESYILYVVHVAARL